MIARKRFAFCRKAEKEFRLDAKLRRAGIVQYFKCRLCERARAYC
jgi:hypothetical protein